VIQPRPTTTSISCLLARRSYLLQHCHLQENSAELHLHGARDPLLSGSSSPPFLFVPSRRGPTPQRHNATRSRRNGGRQLNPLPLRAASSRSTHAGLPIYQRMPLAGFSLRPASCVLLGRHARTDMPDRSQAGRESDLGDGGCCGREVQLENRHDSRRACNWGWGGPNVVGRAKSPSRLLGKRRISTCWTSPFLAGLCLRGSKSAVVKFRTFRFIVRESYVGL
jgi:hypothetical protein